MKFIIKTKRKYYEIKKSYFCKLLNLNVKKYNRLNFDQFVNSLLKYGIHT